MKHFLKTACLSLAALTVVSLFSAQACSCYFPQSASEQMEKSDLVFEGQVINTALEKDPRSFWQRITGQAAPTRMTLTTFQVYRAFKGDPGSNVLVRHLGGEHSAACGVSFKSSQPMIVVTYKDQEGRYTTSSCSQAAFPVEAFEAAAQADAPE